MGKLIARGKGADDVYTGCGETTTFGTNSRKVYVAGTLVHIDGDKNSPHMVDGTDPCTIPGHQSSVIASTESVLIGGKGVARLGDLYDNSKTHGGDAIVKISKVNQTSVYAG